LLITLLNVVVDVIKQVGARQEDFGSFFLRAWLKHTFWINHKHAGSGTLNGNTDGIVASIVTCEIQNHVFVFNEVIILVDCDIKKCFAFIDVEKPCK